jgi:predicted phage terminase large subunit-like protein
MKNTQYSQITNEQKGEVFEKEWLLEYETLPPIKEYHIKVDTASKINEWNDYTVFSLFGKGIDNKAYHIYCQEERIKVPYLFEKLRMFIKKSLKEIPQDFYFYHTRQKVKIKVAIEDKDSGMGLLQTIEDTAHQYDCLENIYFERITRKEGKYARALRSSEKIRNGLYLINTKMINKESLKFQFMMFKSDDSHKFDDMIDTVMDMLNYEIPNPPIVNYSVSGIGNILG